MNIYECIEYSAASDTAVKDVFKNIREQALSEGVATFLELASDEEHNYMLDNFNDEPNARHKSGKWKFRTYLPQSYTSSKSVVITALELGLDITNLGKTAIQKLIKQHKASATVAKSDFEKAQIVLNTLGKLFVKLDPEEQAHIRAEVSVTLIV